MCATGVGEIAEKFLSSVFNNSTWNCRTWRHDKKHKGINFQLIGIRLTNSAAHTRFEKKETEKERKKRLLSLFSKGRVGRLSVPPLFGLILHGQNVKRAKIHPQKKPHGSCRPVAGRKITWFLRAERWRRVCFLPENIVIDCPNSQPRKLSWFWPHIKQRQWQQNCTSERGCQGFTPRTLRCFMRCTQRIHTGSPHVPPC